MHSPNDVAPGQPNAQMGEPAPPASPLLSSSETTLAPPGPRGIGIVKNKMLLKLHPERIYPQANQRRVHGSNKEITPLRANFLKAAGINFLLLQLVFFVLFVYVFGALYQQTDKINALEVLYVDYDGGRVGQAIREAYSSLKGKGFPDLSERPASQVAMGSLRGQICQTHYWAALYTSPGASARLEAALAGVGSSSYNRSDVLTYAWNQARYPTLVDSAVAKNLESLAAAARVIYATNGTFGLVDGTNADAVAAYADPWTLGNINIQPTSQGSRLIYNTLVIILILIQEFFFLGTINGLYAQFKIYNKLYPHRIIGYRCWISLLYTFVGSLCVTGSIWAFRAGWDVHGNQFVLTWLVLWLFAHLNFLAIDLFTVWLAAPYVPMALIAWVITNVASILLPFELSNGFYRWGYALPAHEVYQALIDIWSRGCNPKLHYALPILFAWEVLGLLFSAMGIYRRCHYARVAEDAQEAALRGKTDAALARQQTLDREREAGLDAGAVRGEESAEEVARMELKKTVERQRIEEAVRDEDDNLRKELSRSSKTCGFGPSFGFQSFGNPDDE